MAASSATQTPRGEATPPEDSGTQAWNPTEQAETQREEWPPGPVPLHKVIRRYDLPYFRNPHKNEKLVKHYQNMAQREARMQWIFKHTDEYQKMRDLDSELPHVDYEIAQQYRALLDVLVYVGRSAEFNADGSDESDEEHEWYGRL